MADDGKMPAMKTAAKSLIDQLSALAKNPGDIYISIIPFAKDVNVGAEQLRQATWINWTDWDADNGTALQRLELEGHLQQRQDWTPNNHDTWTGCVTDRDQDYDTKNTTPTRQGGDAVPRRAIRLGSEILQGGQSAPICSRSCR